MNYVLLTSSNKQKDCCLMMRSFPSKNSMKSWGNRIVLNSMKLTKNSFSKVLTSTRIKRSPVMISIILWTCSFKKENWRKSDFQTAEEKDDSIDIICIDYSFMIKLIDISSTIPINISPKRNSSRKPLLSYILPFSLSLPKLTHLDSPSTSQLNVSIQGFLEAIAIILS